MFNGLFSSIFGKPKEHLQSDDIESKNNQLIDANVSESILSDEQVRIIHLDDDKDWLFVERQPTKDNNADKSVDNSSSKPSGSNNLQLVPFKNIFSHLSAVKENDENCLLSANLPSFYPNTMDESWLLTPPSCFSSSSIQIEASPLENLLIEHPSMSVYHNIRRRRSDKLEDLVVLELSEYIDNIDAVSRNFLTYTHSKISPSYCDL
jgi:DOR family